MKLNYIPIGSTKSGFLKEEYINKLNIVMYSEEQFTINNTVEKYYSQVNTTLLVDDYSDLYIRFFVPHMITSDNELAFYYNIGYTPLTKKYFYKFNSVSNYNEVDDYITMDVILDVYDYVYDKKLAKNYLSNVHIYDETQVNNLPFKSTISFKLHFKSITDVDINFANIDDIVTDLVIKMNCILFDDIVIYEKFKTDHVLEFFINNRIYNPITFRYNKLLFSENDKIAKPYTTIISKQDSTVITTFDTAITNQILYNDFVYFIDFKSGDENSFNFLSYSNILPANIKDTGIENSINNIFSNRNYIFANFYYNSFNIINSLKFRSMLTNGIEDYDNLTNYILNILHLNYSTTTDGNNINLTLKYEEGQDDEIIKQFIFYDKDSKYKNVMTNWYENNEALFKQNSLNTTIVQIDAPINEDDNEFNPIDVCLKSYIVQKKILHKPTTFPHLLIYDTKTNNMKTWKANNPVQIEKNAILDDGFINLNTVSTYSISIDSENIVIPTSLKQYKYQTIYPNPSDAEVLVGGLANGISYYTNFNYNTYDNDVGVTRPKLQESTTMKTNISNDCDEFTMSFTFKCKSMEEDEFFRIGDFLKVDRGNVYVFNNDIGEFNSIFDKQLRYNKFNKNGTIHSQYANNTTQTFLVTIRYYYGQITADFINISLNTELEYDYKTSSFTFAYNLKDHQEMNVSNVNIVSGIDSQYSITFGDFDFKNRYVEDFILYDFKEGVRNVGNGIVIGLY